MVVLILLSSFTNVLWERDLQHSSLCLSESLIPILQLLTKKRAIITLQLVEYVSERRQRVSRNAHCTLGMGLDGAGTDNLVSFSLQAYYLLSAFLIISIVKEKRIA